MAEHARTARLDRNRRDDLLVCVDEAVANAIEHAGAEAVCRIWTARDELRCEVTAPKGTLDTALAGYLPPSTSHLNGRGLWIIRQLSDAADMRTGTHGTTILIRMRLPAA